MRQIRVLRIAIFSLLALLPAVLAACFSASPIEVSSLGGSPSLNVSPQWIDLGVAGAGGTSKKFTFWFSNNGGSTAEGCSTPILTGTNASEYAIVSDSCGTNNLPAGSNCTVDIVVKPLATSIDGSFKVAGLERHCANAGTASTQSDGIVIKVSGTGTTAAMLMSNVGAIELGPVASNVGTVTQTITLTNNGAVTASGLSFALGGTNNSSFAIQNNNCASASLAVGASCTLEVAFSPAVGTFSASLQVSFNPSGSLSVPITGIGVSPQLTLTDSGNAALGAVDVTASALPSVTYTLTTTAAASGCAPTLNGSGFTLNPGTCSTSLPADGSCSFTVTPSSSAFGPISTGVSVSCSGGGFYTATPSQRIQAIAVTGTPYVFASDTTIDDNFATAFAGYGWVIRPGVQLTFATDWTVYPHSLVMLYNSRLTHLPRDGSRSYRINLDVADKVLIGYNAAIDANGKGYSGAYQNGRPSPLAPAGIAGGSHGGWGNAYSSAGILAVPNEPFELFSSPSDAGAGGGGTPALPGGSGGGVIMLTIRGGTGSVNTLTLNGRITANGVGSYASGGAGGTVVVNVPYGTFGADSANNGTVISATGGPSNLAAGGGGRIALTLSAPPANIMLGGHNAGDQPQVIAEGGTSVQGLNGGAGTVYWSATGQNHLHFDNNNISGQYAATPLFYDLTTPTLSLYDIVVRRGARATQFSSGATVFAGSQLINAASTTVESGSSLSVCLDIFNSTVSGIYTAVPAGSCVYP